MLPSTPKPVPSARIVSKGAAPLNKDQKTFNDLIKKIEERRARLGEWGEALPIFRQKFSSDLVPVIVLLQETQWQLVQALDTAHDRKGTTKGEKRKLAIMITDMTEDLLTHGERDDIKALFNKHSPSDFDEQEEKYRDGMKTLLEGMLGLDLGDDLETTSTEDFMGRVEAQLWERLEAERERDSRRKKSRREEARAARQEAEEKQLSQSIREVFRKLASALHPDRETDPVERARKTTLMQRANQAYDEGNLLQLLELQLELEHIDQTHLAAIRPERLKHYIKILRGQVQDLDAEIQHVVGQFSSEFGISTLKPIFPEDLLPILQENVDDRQSQIANLHQYIEIAADPQQLKAWLKSLPLRRQTSRSGF
jgi:hypothetical protein